MATSSIPNTCLPVNTNLQHRQFLVGGGGATGGLGGRKQGKANQRMLEEHLTEN